jgi:hypothetical protein
MNVTCVSDTTHSQAVDDLNDELRKRVRDMFKGKFTSQDLHDRWGQWQSALLGFYGGSGSSASAGAGGGGLSVGASAGARV